MVHLLSGTTRVQGIGRIGLTCRALSFSRALQPVCPKGALQQAATFVKRLRAFPADLEVALLRVGRRCQRRSAIPTAIEARPFFNLIMTSLLFIVATHLSVAGELDCYFLLQSAFLSES
jgi:hypothetical protein